MNDYISYKESGIEWLGSIPKSWDLIRLKYLAQITTGNKDAVDAVSDGKYPFFIRSKNVECIDEYAYDGEAVLTAGDGDIGKIVHYIDGKFNFHQRVYCIYNATMSTKLIYYYFGEFFANEAERHNAKSTVDSIRLPVLKNFPIVVPSPKEQKEIVDYLDRVTGQIDYSLDGFENQLKMLETYRREVIANTITKGLDKTAPMKDSGVDWMGEVPKHWNVTKMKWMFEIVKRIYGAEDRDILSITQRGIKIKDIDSNDGQLAESYANYQVVNVNDFAMNSMDLLTGWVDCSPYEGVTSPDYRVFRFHPDKPQCHTYYKYLFQMCYTNRIFYRLGQGVSNLGRWRLQADQFLNIRLPQPPIEEQEQIAAYLDTKVGQIEELTADIKAQIEKLKEYRKIVIHDAVTGKIKVTEGE
ncbi:TPA: restriction endonuclease subunit S [Clostridium sporogenes]|uniref:restriction endonuclease subunit S n=1 Tax=Anaerosporobacter faecicola TaxID=2718714 RepID=UPI00143B7E5F|nr:restriction endonuclease subunit S [Anaerosporobacter faecicola]